MGLDGEQNDSYRSRKTASCHTYLPLNNIILDIGHHRLYKPVNSISTEEKRSFLNVKFANKGLDAINLSNILNTKDVKSKVPPYFKEHPGSIVSFSYTISIASKYPTTKQLFGQLTSRTSSQSLPYVLVKNQDSTTYHLDM